uniref:Janus kinase and microtubule interacting protein 2 n=1 Tax=Sinocyclocheilus grahami TaxID=75366 RepID=A0A672KC46_SINGR
KLYLIFYIVTFDIIKQYHQSRRDNLRNEEQVAIIQASTVLSLAEKVRQAALGQDQQTNSNKEMFCKQKGYLEEELDYRKQALDQAYMQIQELEATLYNALQQDKVIKYGEPLDELQKDELRAAVEKLRRQMLRKSREYDCQVLQERMELLHQAHQVQFMTRLIICNIFSCILWLEKTKFCHLYFIFPRRKATEGILMMEE